jgi:hypothetical protein
MYKTIIASLLSISFLTACSAGAQQDQQEQLSSVTQANQKETAFVIDYNGHSGSVEGQGATVQDAAYDALAWMVTNVWKAGTQEYRDMLTDKGLNVVLAAKASGKAYKGNVKVTRQGVVIDVVAVTN